MARRPFYCAVLVLCLAPLLYAYPNGAPDTPEICKSMTPGHTAPPQVRKAPFKIVVNKDSYGMKDNTIQVTITQSQPGGKMFRGFLIEARRIDKDLSEEERSKPVGFFRVREGTQLICNANGLTHTSGNPGSGQPKTQLNLSWTAMELYGHVEFWATIVVNEATYWVGERSKIVLDESAPAPPVPVTDPPAPLFTLSLAECGETKGCYRYPPGCNEQTCEMVVTWKDMQENIAFEMGGNSDGWIAVGFSEDKKMGDDDVIECYWNADKNKVDVRLSKNLENGKVNELVSYTAGVSQTDGYLSNGRIYCKFVYQKEIQGVDRFSLSDNKYHILLARGPVDDNGKKLIHEMEPGKYPYVSPPKVSLVKIDDITETARYPLVKAHACLMILAWMMCATTAVLMAKYYKPMWPNERLCRERVWFAVHRGCQITNLFCTVIAFILIWVHVWGYSHMPNLPAKAHPPLGIVTTILCVLNPLIALCRPSPTAQRRPIFNWIHWFIGTASVILATPTLFIGLNLPKAHVPWWATWIMVAFLLFHLIIELLLEIHGCMNSKKQKVRHEEFELRKKSDSRGDYYGLEPEPVGRRFKKTVLAIYVFVAVCLGLVMIIAVAVG